MAHQLDVPPPYLAQNRPCLDRCLRSRYLPTQIPFSALPCAAYLSAEDVRQISEVFKSFNLLPDASRSNVNKQNGPNASPFQREHLVDSFTPIGERDPSRNTQASESSFYLEQRSGCGPVQSSNKSGMGAENLRMERPLKGTSPDDLVISKEWLVELLLASIARNFSHEQMKHLSPSRNYNLSTNSATAGVSFYPSGKNDSGAPEGSQGPFPFLPISSTPIGVPLGDNSLAFGFTASKDITTTIVLQRMRRFQQKQAVLSQFKRDLLQWIEPLLLFLDPDSSPRTNERCKEQVDQLHFFHHLMRSHRTQMDESLALSSGLAMPYGALASRHGLAKSKKESKDTENPIGDAPVVPVLINNQCNEVDYQTNSFGPVGRLCTEPYHALGGKDGGVATKLLVSTRTCAPSAVGACQYQTHLPETPLSCNLEFKRSSAATSLPAKFLNTANSSRKSSVSIFEGSMHLSKFSTSGTLRVNSNTSSFFVKNASEYPSPVPAEFILSHQSGDFLTSRTTKELNVPSFVQYDDITESDSSAFLIYYGEQPDGTGSQTFKNILVNRDQWEQFLLEWEHKMETLSVLSEGTNGSANGGGGGGAPPSSRRNNTRQRAVVCWRDFSNNLILPPDFLPTNLAPLADAPASDVRSNSSFGNDASGRHLCGEPTTGRARGEAVYQRVQRGRGAEGGERRAGGGGPRRGHRPSEDACSGDDTDLDQERELRREEGARSQAPLRRRTDRASPGVAGPSRGFGAAANATKGVISAAAAAAAAESEALAEELKGLHMLPADHILISTVHRRFVTSAKDGLLKLWDSDWGNFVGNLLNVGTSWVLHMQLLHKDLYLFVATSNAELTVLEFPSGTILQKYRGCTTLVAALRTVVQPDMGGERRFGLKPGECGPHRFAYRSGMTAKVFNNRLKESRQVKSEATYHATPIEGFVSPTAVCLDPTTLICFFGTAEGTVGAFDLSQRLKASTILGSMSLDEQIPFITKVRAHSPNTPVMGLCYNSVFQYVVSCARDGSVSHIPLNVVQSIEDAPNIIRTFQRQFDTLPLQYFFGDVTSSIPSNRSVQLVAFCLSARLVATVHSDRRILLWSMGRNTVDLVHRFSQETYDIASVAFMPKDHLIAVLTSDLVVSIYDFKGFRPLSVIHVTKCDGCNAEEISSMTMRCPQDDTGGCVSFSPGSNGRLVCALRGPVLFDRSEDKPREDLTAKTKSKASHVTLMPTDEEPKLGLQHLEGMQKSPSPPPAALFAQPKASLQPKLCQNITHRGAIVDVLLRRVRQNPPPVTGAEGVSAGDAGGAQFELHTFSADWWRVWNPLTGDLLREVNLCAEIRKQLPMFRRLLLTVCDWSTDVCARVIAGSRGGQVITLDTFTGAVNNVEGVLVAQRPLSSSKSFLDRFHDTQTNRRMNPKKITASTPTSSYKFPTSETLDADKKTPSQQPVLDAGSLFNLDATVVYHYGMHMIVCGSNRCVLRRYFTNDVDASGEEQFISMSFHLPATARTTITACCIVRDTHICLGTMDTRLFFYRMVDGSEPYAEEPLRSDVGVGSDVGECEPEIGAVIGLFFLNDSNQNLFVIVLDTGVVHVYSYLTNRSVARFRLHRAHECRIRKVIYRNGDEQLLICGDSLGRVRVLDISAFKTGMVDFATAIKERCVFQGAPEEVSSLVYFTMPSSLGSVKSQEAYTRHRGLSGAVLRHGTALRRSTTASSLAGRSGKEGDRFDSEFSQGSLVEATTERTGSSFNSSARPSPVEGRDFGGANHNGFVVVGGRDGNVRLFALQRQYERMWPRRRSSLRMLGLSDASHIGARRTSLLRPSFCVSGSTESSTVFGPGFMTANTSPTRDNEGFFSRRRRNYTLNLTYIGIFGQCKWDAMDPDTFQHEFLSPRTGEVALGAVSSKCSRSSSVILSEGQDESFLDFLLIQAKKNIEANSYATSQTLQCAFPIDDRTTSLGQTSAKRKAFDHAKGIGTMRKVIQRPSARREAQVKTGKSKQANYRIPQQVREEQQQQPKDSRCRIISQRELKLLEMLLPRKDPAVSLVASMNTDDSPTKVSCVNTRLYRRLQWMHGNIVDHFLCVLRPRRILKRKYQRNVLLKMYPVSWLRKIEVIPNSYKIADYLEDGSPRLIPTENVFNGCWDLSVPTHCDNSNEEIGDISDNTMDTDKRFSKDTDTGGFKMNCEATSQETSMEVPGAAECPALTDTIDDGDKNRLDSTVQKKPLLETSIGAQSMFITELENITTLKTPKLTKLNYFSSSNAQLPTSAFAGSLSVSTDVRHFSNSQIRGDNVLPNLSLAEPLILTKLSQNSSGAPVLTNASNTLSPPLCKVADSDNAIIGKTLQQHEGSASEKQTPRTRSSSTFKPVFIGDEPVPAFESLTTSASLLAETAPRAPTSTALYDDIRPSTKNKTYDSLMKDNMLQNQLQTALSGLSAVAVGQRYDQTILAHFAHQLDRVRPSGYTPGSFMGRVKQVWQQRSIEDASQTMMLEVSKTVLHHGRGSLQASTSATARGNRGSPVARGKSKDPSKALTKHRYRSGPLCVLNHEAAQQDPGIGLNLALLSFPTDKKRSIVSWGEKHGVLTSAVTSTKDNASNFEKNSTLPGHERLYRKLESWKHRQEQDVAERRRVVDRLMGRTTDGKTPKPLPLIPNRLVHLPLLYAEQTLEPVHVSPPTVVLRYSDNPKDH